MGKQWIGPEQHDGSRRADLQGLRALAVLSVVLFHSGLQIFPGGFVGVDIFFVLSGFLISRLLVRDIEQHGRVRLAVFWANRAKRLLPNALFVLIAVLCTTYVIVPQYRHANIGQDVLSAGLFWSNFHFAARAVDYFHLGDPPSPVLHFWSLSVEEQFYFVLPVLMTGVALALPAARVRFALVAIIGVVVVASFASSLAALQVSQPAAFFLPQNRVWQLASGGLLGVLFHSRKHIPATVRAVLAWAGMGLIALAIVLFNDQMIYPGGAALVPTIGTALLILGLDAGSAARGLSAIFSTAPVRFIGDQSYSIYLWHWPVIIFAQELFGQSLLVSAFSVALTFALASLAYFYVEKPIHNMDLRHLQLRPVYLTSAGALTLVTVASLIIVKLPVRGRSPESSAAVTAVRQDLGLNYRNGCHLSTTEMDQPPCQFGLTRAPHRVVLFGDSHAAQWFTPLSIAAARAGWELHARTKSNCPSADVTIWNAQTRVVYSLCDTWREERLQEIEASRPALVIVANSSRYRGWVLDRNTQLRASSGVDAQIWRDGMRRTVSRLMNMGVHVIVVRDTPAMFRSYSDCLSAGGGSQCSREKRDALHGIAQDAAVAAQFSRFRIPARLYRSLVCRTELRSRDRRQNCLSGRVPSNGNLCRDIRFGFRQDSTHWKACAGAIKLV